MPPSPRTPSRVAARPRPGGRRADTPVTVPPDDRAEIRYIDRKRVDRARRAMPPDGAFRYAAEMLRTLGDPTRLRIARALAIEELCVFDLAHLLGLSQPTVSHSLRALRQLGLVRYRRDGRVAYYALDDTHIVQVLDSGLAHAAAAQAGT